MQSVLLDPHNPKFFHTASLYQDVPGLQSAKCTYVGTQADSRRKLRLPFALKVSKKKPNCAFARTPGMG
jgi:hypothetical protein